MGKRLSSKVDQEALFRSGLESAADGCAASGAGLAALALKLAALAPQESRHKLEEKAWSQISQKPEFAELANLGDLASPGWFDSKNPLLQHSLLHSAAQGFTTKEAVTDLLQTPISGRPLKRLVSSQTNDSMVATVVGNGNIKDEQRREFASQFLLQNPSSASERANFAISQGVLPKNLITEMSEALAQQGNASAKFLELAATVKNPENYDKGVATPAYIITLQNVSDDGANAGPKALVEAALKMGTFKGLVSTTVGGFTPCQLSYQAHQTSGALLPTLSDALPEGQWKQALQIVQRSSRFAPEVMDSYESVFARGLTALANVREDQSPLLVASHSVFSTWLRYRPGLEKEFQTALALATDSNDIKVLEDSLRTFRASGEQAALKVLKEGAKIPDEPKPVVEAPSSNSSTSDSWSTSSPSSAGKGLVW